MAEKPITRAQLSRIMSGEALDDPTPCTKCGFTYAEATRKSGSKITGQPYCGSWSCPAGGLHSWTEEE